MSRIKSLPTAIFLKETLYWWNFISPFTVYLFSLIWTHVWLQCGALSFPSLTSVFLRKVQFKISITQVWPKSLRVLIWRDMHTRKDTVHYHTTQQQQMKPVAKHTRELKPPKQRDCICKFSISTATGAAPSSGRHLSHRKSNFAFFFF